MHVDREPRHLFDSLFAPHVFASADRRGLQRPGLRPDGSATVSLPRGDATGRGQRRGKPLPARRLLFEGKTVHLGTSLYQTARARADQAGAVAERAHRVVREYRDHARQLDGRYAAPGTTPFSDRLQGFTNVRGLVVGDFGEWSPDLHDLLTLAGRELAAKSWRSLGARSEAEARGWLTASLRRRVSCLCARALASHRLRRLCLVGVPRRALDERLVRGGPGLGGGRAREHQPGLTLEDFFGFQVLHARDGEGGA